MVSVISQLRTIASTIFKTQKTLGNYNGEYGLPLTLLELEEDTQLAILEMGMSNQGEIKLLSEIARPDIAIITMIGVSHISTLGSKEAIAKAKLEILTGMNPEGILICNGDEPLIKIGLSELNVPQRHYTSYNLGNPVITIIIPLNKWFQVKGFIL
jgi:UDP-N-acetylmuramoyl-tripeptide--D-alanyl-D-alanine ligase